MTRILWVGCHKLLVRTELQALRDLGYEVYRPTYLSSIYDQSAVLEKDINPSTLPEHILEKLETTNFFYDEVSQDMADILNEYFEVCIITISPNWLKNLAKAFRGKILYRTFGQPYSLSAEFDTIGLTSTLLNRDNFYYLPHSIKSLESEHSWLVQKAIEVPYWVEDDVFQLENTWSSENTKQNIGLLCPNIENVYYASHYKYLQLHFKKKFYKIFGVQKAEEKDKWIVGTLDRKILLQEFQALSGFQYTYGEKNTCYLPPIEAAIIGVPILYPKGSLISKYIGSGAPGEWKNEREANYLAERLLHKDMDFINQVLAAQSVVKDLYRKESCISIFTKVFESIITNRIEIVSTAKNRVVIPFYFPGNLINFDGLNYSAAEGIPRVIRFFSGVLLNKGYEVILLTYGSQSASTWGYFNQDRVKDYAKVFSIERDGESLFVNISRTFKPLSQKLPVSIRIRLAHSLRKIIKYFNKENIEEILQEELESEIFQTTVLIPHYYHFREINNLDLQVPVILYLPDYIPYLFPSDFRSEVAKFESTGKVTVKKADLVITNSKTTQGYLPQTPLRVDPLKIRVFPLPRLGNSEVSQRVEVLYGTRFLIYPTQFRPNKRIDLLLAAFDSLPKSLNVFLALTGNLANDLRAKNVYQRMKNKSRVHFLGLVSDGELNWMYENCEIVVVSSESEGNFPTQVSEAIYYAKPFIAAAIDVVLEELGQANDFHLFESGSASDLSMKLKTVMENLDSEKKRMRDFAQEFNQIHRSEAESGILRVMDEAFNNLGKQG
jgi:glycosyltransferase involved in cell wall biosynthesis